MLFATREKAPYQFDVVVFSVRSTLKEITDFIPISHNAQSVNTCWSNKQVMYGFAYANPKSGKKKNASEK